MERIYHTWDKWECYPAGFYENRPPNGMSADEAAAAYRDFLADIPRFEAALARVVSEWPNSCEHYLTNENMNRIAWLGQASMCIDTGVSSVFRGGFNRLSEEQKEAANAAALKWLNVWLSRRGERELTAEEAKPKTEANLY